MCLSISVTVPLSTLNDQGRKSDWPPSGKVTNHWTLTLPRSGALHFAGKHSHPSVWVGWPVTSQLQEWILFSLKHEHITFPGHSDRLGGRHITASLRDTEMEWAFASASGKDTLALPLRKGVGSKLGGNKNLQGHLVTLKRDTV